MNNTFRFFKQLLIVAIVLVLLTSTRMGVARKQGLVLTVESRFAVVANSIRAASVESHLPNQIYSRVGQSLSAEPAVTTLTFYTFTIPSSIGLPMQLRVNPKRNELYARGYEDQRYEDQRDPHVIPPQWYTLARFDLTTRRSTGVIVLPQVIEDYGITGDGRWLYAVTSHTLYSIDLNTFKVVAQFTPTDISPGNAELYRVGVFSSTLAYISTNPGYASGGPIYQWNPQTNEWSATPFCGSAARAVLDVARDLTAIGGVCDPNASPSTTFLYRLDGSFESWTGEIRWSVGTSPHGDWVLSSFWGTGTVGDSLTMHHGDPNYRYITASSRYSHDTIFHDRYDLGYATAGIYNPSILEISPGLASQTRAFGLSPIRPGDEYYFMPGGQGPLATKGNWMYAAVWPQYYAEYVKIGDIVAFYIEPLDAIAPVSEVIDLPPFSAPSFPVHWIGYDAGSTVCLYDVQYRDGQSNVWTTWLTQTTQMSAIFTGTIGGHTYYFRSRARDCVGNIESYPSGNGDTYTIVDASPPSSSASSPLNASTPQFVVTWSGSDSGSGLSSYDVQYRDGSSGVWTDLIINTTQTSLVFSGQLGHTYYFQTRARDRLGNVEAYPGGNGDTTTHMPHFMLSGTVEGNRDQAIALAHSLTDPAALNTPLSDHRGNFNLYYNSTGTYSLTVARNNFGALPPMMNLTVSDTSSSPIVYLPPIDDQISDGHFESGTLSAWNPTGDLTPTITTTAHTGSYAALLGGTVPSNTLSTGPYLSAIEQTLTMPVTLTNGTLSLLCEVTAADPLSDTLTAYLIGPTDTLTLTLPLTTSGWTHQWFDVAAWTAPTATLRLELSTPDKERPVGVLVDEVTLGASPIGSYPAYLPIMPR
jgi:hypothetical protein